MRWILALIMPQVQDRSLDCSPAYYHYATAAPIPAPLLAPSKSMVAHIVELYSNITWYSFFSIFKGIAGSHCFSYILPCSIRTSLLLIFFIYQLKFHFYSYSLLRSITISLLLVFTSVFNYNLIVTRTHFCVQLKSHYYSYLLLRSISISLLLVFTSAFN